MIKALLIVIAVFFFGIVPIVTIWLVVMGEKAHRRRLREMSKFAKSTPPTGTEQIKIEFDHKLLGLAESEIRSRTGDWSKFRISFLEDLNPIARDLIRMPSVTLEPNYLLVAHEEGLTKIRWTSIQEIEITELYLEVRTVHFGIVKGALFVKGIFYLDMLRVFNLMWAYLPAGVIVRYGSDRDHSSPLAIAVGRSQSEGDIIVAPQESNQAMHVNSSSRSAASGMT